MSRAGPYRQIVTSRGTEVTRPSALGTPAFGMAASLAAELLAPTASPGAKSDSPGYLSEAAMRVASAACGPLGQSRA